MRCFGAELMQTHQAHNVCAIFATCMQLNSNVIFITVTLFSNCILLFIVCIGSLCRITEYLVLSYLKVPPIVVNLLT